MATFEKRTTHQGKIVWRVKVRRKGISAQSATFAWLRDAKKWAHITEGAILEGRHFKAIEAKRHTVSEMIDRYLQDVMPHKRYSTAQDQRRQLQWWSTQLRHCTLADVTPAHIVACRDRLAQGKRSNATVVRYLAVLSHAFTIAPKEWCWIEDNPVRKVKKPKESHGRVRFLSDEERERLLVACRVSRNRLLYPIVVLALSTGVRAGELFSLTWRDVDMQRGTRRCPWGSPRTLTPYNAIAITGCIARSLPIQTRGPRRVRAKTKRMSSPVGFHSRSAPKYDTSSRAPSP